MVLLLQVSLPASAPAGGSGLNVTVVVNQNSADSVQLGNYFCERRQVPPQNLLRMTNWAGGNGAWSRAQFESCLLNPLLTALSGRGLTNQIEFVALSMDIPYRVADGSGSNSTTSALFYGFKTNDAASTDECTLATSSTNLYAFSELPFRLSSPGSNANTFLVTMLTGDTFEAARELVDQGVTSDASWPIQTVLLAKTTDPLRNVRFFNSDNAVFDTRVNGRPPMLRTNSDQTFGLTNLLGLQTGLASLSLSPNTFVPGAMADSLTSYAGLLFEPTGMTPLLAFINAGAAGSYGTVTEPCNYQEKFPDPLTYFYQARGFSLAECYYQSLANPYEGLIVAEPLAAPFALPGSGRWVGLASNAILSGTAELTLEFQAPGAQRPLQQVDLFLDGTKLQTLTNLWPAQSNLLSVALPGFTTNYAVPAGATLASIANDLATAINAVTNVTSVEAFAYGDRLELESLDVSRTGPQTAVGVSNAIGGAATLTTFISASRPTFLDSVARGWRIWQVSGISTNGDYLQANVIKTSGENVSLAVTNSSPPVSTVQLTQQLLALINATPALQGPDGISAEDSYPDPYGTNIQFLIYARTPGLQAAQIQVQLAASTNLLVSPNDMNILGDNVTDLRPRNHLYLTAGVINLAFSFPLDTTRLADGSHELTAVAYEGSHVRTQARVTQTVRVKNTPLTAAFTCLVGDTNTAIEATLQFSVVANTSAVASIELFSTGGAVGVVSNQAAATFSVAGTNLGLGLHPFSAVVTGTSGAQYRTETKWIRLVGADLPFPLTITWPPPSLAWSAVTGRRYEVLSTDTLTNTLQLRASVTPTNDAGRWTDVSPFPSDRFYRVRAAP